MDEGVQTMGFKGDIICLVLQRSVPGAPAASEEGCHGFYQDAAAPSPDSFAGPEPHSGHWK